MNNLNERIENTIINVVDSIKYGIVCKYFGGLNKHDVLEK